MLEFVNYILKLVSANHHYDNPCTHISTSLFELSRISKISSHSVSTWKNFHPLEIVDCCERQFLQCYNVNLKSKQSY